MWVVITLSKVVFKMRVRLPCRTDDVEGVNHQGEGGGKKDINDNGKIKHEDQDNKEKNSEAKGKEFITSVMIKLATIVANFGRNEF